MKINSIKMLITLGYLLLSLASFGQNANIEVKKLYSDSNSSSFEITIEDSVRLHYHSEHTENIFVIEGEAKMQLNEEFIQIKKGDHLVIPQGSKHAVWVESKNPLKVISVQSPEFDGKDRHFVDE